MSGGLDDALELQPGDDVGVMDMVGLGWALLQAAQPAGKAMRPAAFF